MEEYERRTYFENDDYRVYLENILDNVFIHIVIFNINKPIVRDLKKMFGEIVLKMYFLGYEELFCYTTDNRIVKIIGGATKVAENVKFQNKDYEVWKWDLS